jgi:mannosyltransferase PIG-V
MERATVACGLRDSPSDFVRDVCEMALGGLRLERQEIHTRDLDWRSWLEFPIAVWLFSRPAIFIWAIIATQILPVRELTIVGEVPEPPAAGLNLLIAPWARWDTLWYLRIATRGYAVGDLTGGFFPLYPLAIRALTWILPNALFNALLISNLAALGAFIVFYRLARSLFDEATARRGLIYWVAFPTSFYFFAGYAEALFVFAAILSIAAARKDQWTLAGAAAGLTALARPFGFSILAPLGIEWLKTSGRIVDRLKLALPIALVPICIGAYMLYLQWTFGDAFFFLHAWEDVAVTPWQLASHTLAAIMAGTAIGNNLIDFSLTLLVLGLVVRGWRRMPGSFTLYALILIFIQMLAYAPTQGFADMPMNGMGRRVAVVFPAFLSLAQVWHGRFRESVWLGVSSCLQLVFISIFVCGYWLD